MESFEKVYPTAKELGTINKNQNCPECCAIFNSESNLNLHLAKTHKRLDLLQSKCNKIYYCPIETCNYNKTPHFTKLKLLKQHFLKVHSAGNFLCSLCKKGFPTASICKRHEEYCDVVFKCCDCEMFYHCYETLKTHSRRKKHHILEKTAYKPTPTNLLKMQKPDESVLPKKLRLLLPKANTIPITDTSDQSCQTPKSNHSQQTQTLLASTMPHFTVETQTIGDYFTPKSNMKCVKTQTVSEDPKNASCSKTFSLDDHLGLNKVEQNSSSTQTSLYKEPEHIYCSTSTHDSIYTDTSDLLTDMLDSNFFSRNTETQTDFIFNDELFRYCDDYTNMWTQTCEDLLLREISLNDNHTQTFLDDVLKSVESQTVMSQSPLLPLGKDNTTHMETQTSHRC